MGDETRSDGLQVPQAGSPSDGLRQRARALLTPAALPVRPPSPPRRAAQSASPGRRLRRAPIETFTLLHLLIFSPNYFKNMQFFAQSANFGRLVLGYIEDVCEQSFIFQQFYKICAFFSPLGVFFQAFLNWDSNFCTVPRLICEKSMKISDAGEMSATFCKHLNLFCQILNTDPIPSSSGPNPPILSSIGRC